AAGVLRTASLRRLKPEKPGWRRAPDQEGVEAMFDGLVDRYDLLNRLISLGLDRSWRRRTIAAIQPHPGMHVLDLGCGTGDLLELLVPPSPAAAGEGRVREAGAVVGIDVSQRMLNRAHQRLGRSVLLVRGSAFRLPFPSASFQAAVSGFVLRNLRDLEGALAELARVVAPGGQIALLDATEPRGVFRPLFDAYFRVAAPALGALAGRRGAYQYLAASLGQIPPPAQMCLLLEAAGFDACAAQPLSLGMVTLFTGRRSSAR
ncbi:MAG TPA: ubiquinone/menaquinone biosynthesis methyltransferase, partial [Chloroflexota bacterium]